MPTMTETGCVEVDRADRASASAPDALSALPTAAAAAAALLAACGGGGDAGSASGTGAAGGTVPGAAPLTPTDAEAARFLAQASMGATRADIARVQALGYTGWIEEQFALPQSASRWDWLVANGYGAETYRNTQAGFDAALWKKLLASPDTLRQRATLALSEILVVAIDGLVGAGWRAFSAAAYADLLESGAFGTWRELLQRVSTSAPMGQFLTFRGNLKANAARGSSPDENYARELMQLFTIGLVELNADATPKLSGGVPKETYTQADIGGLARVFTGWDFDRTTTTDASPQEFLRVPMAQVASRHEPGAKTFLGTTISAGTNGADSLRLALDAIHAHANVAPFVGRQLIQRLVASNPSPAYVARVAAMFDDNGAGVRGDLKAVLKAVLLDPQARTLDAAAPHAGKLREPMLRFAGWARAYGATSPSDQWAVGNTSDPATRLGQSPLRAPSVFNFFRPGYVPPNTALGTLALQAPEFQITNESSVVGYVNFMQRVVASGIGDVKADYTALLALAPDAAALVGEIVTVLAAGQLSTATAAAIAAALESIAVATDAGRRNRVHAGLTLVLAAPEFIALK